jgi:hypothetical protein
MALLAGLAGFAAYSQGSGEGPQKQPPEASDGDVDCPGTRRPLIKSRCTGLIGEASRTGLYT